MFDQEAVDRFLRKPLFWFVITVVILAVVIVVQFVTIDHRTASLTEIINVIENLLVGILVSFVFYFLVVRLPEKQRRNRLRRNFLQTYLSIKEGLIWQIVFASRQGGRLDLETTTDQIAELMNVTFFKKCFSGGKQSDEGWYAFIVQEQ